MSLHRRDLLPPTRRLHKRSRSFWIRCFFIFLAAAQAAEFDAAAFSAPLGEAVTCVTSFGAHVLRVSDQRRLGVITQLPPPQLKALLDAGPAERANHQLVDVREASELYALPRYPPLAYHRATQPSNVGQLHTRGCGKNSPHVSPLSVSTGGGGLGALKGESLALEPASPN